MRRIGVGFAVAVVLFALLAWLFRPGPTVSGTATRPEPASAPRPVREARAPEPPAEAPLDPQVLRDAIAGRLGIELSNRVCTACASGLLEDAACTWCLDSGPRGRVHVDVVDSEGRAFDPSEATSSVSCGTPRGGGRIAWTLGEEGFVDIPAADDCRVSARRFQGPFVIQSDPVPLSLAPGTEAHVEIELPTASWGGVGVTIRSGPDGAFIESLVPGTAAAGALPLGSQIVAIDGRSVLELGFYSDQIAGALGGPAGSEVEVAYRYDGPDGPVDDVVVLERSAYAAGDVKLGAGPAG